MREFFVIDSKEIELVEVFYSAREAVEYAAQRNRECGDKFRFKVKRGSLV